MNAWMYAIREFEDAIDDCVSCGTATCNEHSNDPSVHAWDEGVAFYAGSLEGTVVALHGTSALPSLQAPVILVIKRRIAIIAIVSILMYNQ